MAPKTTTNEPLQHRPITSLKGVGPRIAGRLQALGIESIADLLFHLPLRYEDRTQITPIGALTAGCEAVIEGTVRLSDIVYGRRRSLVCRLEDGSGIVTLRFFHFSAAQRDMLQPGARLRCYGEARYGRNGTEIYHPEYQCLNAATPPPLPDRLTPIYPSTEGIHQTGWRKLTTQALAMLAAGSIKDLLPAAADQRIGCSVTEALHYLHAPPVDAPLDQLADGRHRCQRRLALEELVAHHMSLLRLRQRLRCEPAPPLAPAPQLQQQFLAALPFVPTAAQQRVAGEISADLAGEQPMLRLVQGDVGSGKTLVAAMAALQAVASGYQVALMAPTEILAEQHRDNFEHWFAPLDIGVAWLAGRQRPAQRREALAAIAGSKAGVIIGTHALFQEPIAFPRLGLIIVDEQHRFGVHQRLLLREKGATSDRYPHQLIMTATPIPRTLAMTAYADLDCSIIDELPPGRTPAPTIAVDNRRRGEVVERVRRACLDGGQAYWVCTLIEESEALQAQAAEATAAELTTALPELHIGLVHGRLKSREKAAMMEQFKSGALHLLVATTVIEVGVDVANASLMIIENPERLGLAQLHQLRGRVGRGRRASHCVLLYRAPLSLNGKARLAVMRESNDGFYIAQRDLELRGPGEVLGTRQTGIMALRIANLLRDHDLIDDVRRVADEIIRQSPQHAGDLIDRWLPGTERYAQV